MVLDDLQRKVLDESLQSSTSDIWNLVLRSDDPKLQSVLGDIFVRLENSTLVNMGSGKDDSITHMFVHGGAQQVVDVDEIEHKPDRVIPFTSFRKAEMGEFVADPKVLAELRHGKQYPSTNFMFNAINGPFIHGQKTPELLSLLPFYMQEGDFIFGVESDIPEFLAKPPFSEIFQCVYHKPGESPFFAFRLHMPPKVENK